MHFYLADATMQRKDNTHTKVMLHRTIIHIIKEMHSVAFQAFHYLSFRYNIIQQ